MWWWHAFRVFLLSLLSLVVSTSVQAQVSTGGSATTADHQKQIVGYITNWDAWKSTSAGVPAAGALTHMNIDYAKYTILNYSFFGVANDGSLHSGDYRNKLIYQEGQEQAPAPLLHGGVYDSWDMHLIFGELEYKWDFTDEAVIAAGFVADGAGWKNTITGLTGDMPIPFPKEGGAKGLIDMAHEYGVKVVASIGGWSMCKHFPEMAANTTLRANFIADCERLMVLGFDGIDLDWEYPGPFAGMNFTGSEADFANFTSLVQEIRNAIGADKLITAAFSASPTKLAGFDWASLSGVMDYFNMMTYDFNGGWSDIAGHNAPLYDYPGQEVANFSWDACYQALVSMGVPANKINMGSPFYGRGVITSGAAALNGATAKTQRTVDPDGPITTCADYTNWSAFDGTPNYEYIRQQKSSWTEHWDDDAKVPYLTNGNYFLSYDNEESIGYKAQYVVDKGLAGTIVWTVFGDLEISGTATAFGPKLVRYSSVKSPLVNKINEVFASGGSGPQSPVVTITAPANGTTVVPGSEVDVTVTATDADGTIAKVTFLLDGVSLGEVTTSPYTYTIGSLAEGTHTIAAVATDNEGYTTTAAVSITASNSTPPIVALTSPTAGASFAAGAAITLTADASADGSIASVAFYQGTTLLGTVTSSPYTYTWSSVAAGTYSLTAIATDDDGATTTSAAVSVTVTASSGACEGVDTWDAASVYTSGMEVSYNGVLYSARWWTQGENPETHSGESQVWENLGTCTPANAGPTVAITSPTGGTAYTSPASLTISASAADSDGSVTKVAFYYGSTLLGEITSAPYTYTWSNVTTGAYTLKAIAMDDSGNTTTSAAVTITVGDVVAESDFKVVGYMPSYQGAASDIQYTKLTHINYAFIRPTTTGGLTAVENASKLQEIVSLAHANGVKVGIAIGGWSDLNNTDFQTMAASATYRAAFISNVLSFISTYSLDGADIDWEYPIDGSDPANFSTLMSEMATALHAQDKYLTAAVSAQGYYAGGILDSVFPSVDFLNLMVYDGGSGADHAPYSYAESSLSYWLGRGLPAEKAVLGVPFYSRPSWLTYATLISQGADPYADVYNGDYYNGITTIKAKTNLAFDNGIGGMMIWETSQDVSGTYSLLNAIDEVVTARAGGGTGDTNQAPAVSIASPASGASYTAPASITITASASDSDGSIASVSFYNGSTLLGQVTTSPYTYTWSSVAAGTYSVTAVATDDDGASTTSSAISVTVTSDDTGGGDCGDISAYVEAGGYEAGSQVQNDGSIYQCREWPYSGWCDGAAWAYAPGTGTYWEDAWTLVGTCAAAASASASARIATVASETADDIFYAPNPFAEKLTVTVTVSETTDLTMTLFSFQGVAEELVFSGTKKPGRYQFEIAGSRLARGIHILCIEKVTEAGVATTTYRKLIKK